MSNTYQFVVDGSTITMFEQQDDGSFEQDTLKLNQTLSYDATTGDVTLSTTHDDMVKVEVFHQTADQTDDPSLYSEGETSYTALDGTPVMTMTMQNDQGNGQGKHVTGTAGDDNEHGGRGNDHIDGGEGNDHVSGGAGDDDLNGGNGDDHLSGGAGFDALHGGSGNDNISGGADDDILTGDNGNDVLNGGTGNDHVDGGNGNDRELGGAGDDTVSGDAGNDRIDGGDGSDTLNGDAGNDKLNGGTGDDTLHGGTGNDVLNGGTGDDTLDGGAGVDRMTGGAGADHFVFTDADLGGATTIGRISDFSHAQGDLIDLSGIDANSTVDGDQAFSFIGSSAFSHTAGELRVTESHHNTVVMGDTNGDGIADFAIKLADAPALDVADFVL